MSKMRSVQWLYKGTTFLYKETRMSRLTYFQRCLIISLRILQDGDYNKVLSSSSEYVTKSPKSFKRSPPKNGLCKMCNINQQLKVTQLANFVPMNENRYDEEIDLYRYNSSFFFIQ